MKTYTILDFSLRKNGNTYQISDYIANQLQPKHHVQQIHFSEKNIHPCGICDYECFIKRNLCPYANDDIYAIYEACSASDEVILIVPNYYDYPNAIYFAFQERTQSAFIDYQKDFQRWLNVPKKYIAISNTNTDNFITAFKLHVKDEQPQILFLKSRDVPTPSIAGDLINYDSVKEKIDQFIKG